jgi:hypothetical protein
MNVGQPKPAFLELDSPASPIESEAENEPKVYSLDPSASLFTPRNRFTNWYRPSAEVEERRTVDQVEAEAADQGQVEENLEDLRAERQLEDATEGPSEIFHLKSLKNILITK